jgi:hypothetical protein
MKRTDDYDSRRAHLAKMSDEELQAYFWKLADQLTDPLLKLGYENSSPAVERSVLLRMGFSSLEVKPIVDTAMEKNLIAHGAGNIVYKVAQAQNMSARDAGVALSKGELWDVAQKLFGEVQA